MQTSLFAIDVEDDNPVLVLRLRGELDVAGVPLVHDAVERRAAGRPGLIVDLGALEFMDVSGLGLMVRLRDRTGIEVAFGQPNASIGRLLDLTGLRAGFHWVA